MSPKTDMTHSNDDLLSAYIDGMLAADERAHLEKRLAADAVLADELAALRQTVALINQLPRLKAPHNFTLTKEMVEQKGRLELVHRPSKKVRGPFIIPLPLMRIASAAAALLLVVLGAMILLLSQDSATTNDTANTAFMATNPAEVGLHSNTAPVDIAVTRAPLPTSEMLMQAEPPEIAAGETDGDSLSARTMAESTQMLPPMPESYGSAEFEDAQMEMQMLDDMGGGIGMGGGGYDNAFDTLSGTMADDSYATFEPPSEQEQSVAPAAQAPLLDTSKTSVSPTKIAIASTQIPDEATPVATKTSSATDENGQPQQNRQDDKTGTFPSQSLDTTALLGIVLIFMGSVCFIAIAAIIWKQNKGNSHLGE